MKQLADRRVAEQGLEVGRVVSVRSELDQMAFSVAGGKLRHAQAVALQIEALGLGINRNRLTKVDAAGNVNAVESVPDPSA